MSTPQSGSAGQIPIGSTGAGRFHGKTTPLDPTKFATGSAYHEALAARQAAELQAAGSQAGSEGVNRTPAQVGRGDAGIYQDLNPWPSVEWDPFVGCEPISPGCRECYGARRVSVLAPNHPCVTKHDGIPAFTGEVFFAKTRVTDPLLARNPEIVFYCAHCDPFQPKIEIERTAACVQTMRETPQHRYNVLTKYSNRMKGVIERVGPLPGNVRLGISAETQKYLDERWAHLREVHAQMYILSLEPILGPITIPKDFHNGWVVAMREVGKNPRDAKPEWFRSLREQCRELGVPFYWETTAQDGRELVEERLRANREGDPYLTQGLRWGLPVIGQARVISGQVDHAPQRTQRVGPIRSAARSALNAFKRLW